MEHNRMGAVASGLIKYPIPGKNPPADCKIAVIQAKKDTNMSFIVFLCLLKLNWAERISLEIGFKKYTFPPSYKCNMRCNPLYLPIIRGGTILNNSNSEKKQGHIGPAFYLTTTFPTIPCWKWYRHISSYVPDWFGFTVIVFSFPG